jgi:hypothetical protein
MSKHSNWKEFTTKRQRNAIKLIEAQCGVKFQGNTKEDAYTFIGKYLHDAQTLQALDHAAGNAAVPVYHASFSTREQDGEVLLDRRNRLANEKLKSDLLRSRNAAEALSEFARNSRLEEFLEDEEELY